MATGDVDDMAWRIYVVLPQRWFPDLQSAPILRGLLSGFGQAWSFCFALIVYAKQQARIASATGSFIDMLASDFFGSELRRRPQENDAAFRARIEANLLSEKVTRSGVCSAVSRLTGASVQAFEPGRPADTGGYGGSGVPTCGGGFGYGSVGLAYGSLNLPYQILLRVTRPASITDVLQVSGYGSLTNATLQRASGGYNVGALEYVSETFLGNTVTDDDIRSMILSVIPVNTIAWLSFV